MDSRVPPLEKTSRPSGRGGTVVVVVVVETLSFGGRLNFRTSRSGGTLRRSRLDKRRTSVQTEYANCGNLGNGIRPVNVRS